jgi:Gas vesicle protein G
MVLLKLLSLPISLPVSGMKFVLQQVADLADQELYDPSVVHEQLLLLHVQLEDGDIDEDEYAEREAELMARLRDIRARNQQGPAEADVDARRRAIVETPFDEQ